MRGATLAGRYYRYVLKISIHAPHAGSDLIIENADTTQVISIHAPHAGSDEDVEYL